MVPVMTAKTRRSARDSNTNRRRCLRLGDADPPVVFAAPRSRDRLAMLWFGRCRRRPISSRSVVRVVGGDAWLYQKLGSKHPVLAVDFDLVATNKFPKVG